MYCKLSRRTALGKGLLNPGEWPMYSANDDSLTESEREQLEDQWLHEVASRLDRYRCRRKKKAAPQTSLPFDFEQAEQSTAPANRWGAIS